MTETVLSLTDDVFAIAKKLYNIAEPEHAAHEHLDKKSVTAISEDVLDDDQDASSITSVPTFSQLNKLQHAKKLVKNSQQRLEIARAQTLLAQKRLEGAEGQSRLAEERLDWAQRKLDLAQDEMDDALRNGGW